MSAAVIALATTLAIVLVLASVVIGLLYTQLRKKRSYNGIVEVPPLTPGFGFFNFLPSWHPAAQITPFGSSPQGPVFTPAPGKNMRIAHMNPHGGWEFFDTGLAEDEKLPRPQSVQSSTFARTVRSPSTSEFHSSSNWTSESSVSREPMAQDFPPAAPPPPAYCKNERH